MSAFARFHPDDDEEVTIRQAVVILNECYCPQYQQMFIDLCEQGMPPSIVTSFFISHFCSSIVGLSAVFTSEANGLDTKLINSAMQELGHDLSDAVVKFQKTCLKVKEGMN